MAARRASNLWADTAIFLLALLLFCAPFYVALLRLSYHWNWEPIWDYRRMLWSGWVTTVQLSAVSLVTSTLFGFAVALCRRAPIRLLRYTATIYVEVIRGTPLLVQILILYYGVFDQIGIGDRFVSSVLILTGFAGAYMSEIFRAGIESVGNSQLESARAIGLTTSQTYRYVILPQAIRQTLPPLAGEFASLIKNSSLLSIIGFTEFTLAAQQVNSFTYSTLESYLPLAVGYLILTLPISLWTRRLEQQHRFDT